MSARERAAAESARHPSAESPLPPLSAHADDTSVACGGAPTDGAADALSVVKAFNRAFAANDSERYFGFVGEDITVMTPSNPYRVDGIEDDRAEFEAGLRSGATRVHFFQEMQPKVQLYGDTAVVTYFSRGRYGSEGSARTAYFKETDVLVRRDGAWKIVHVHVSATS